MDFGCAAFSLIGLFFVAVTFDEHGLSRVLRYLFDRDGFVAVGWLFAVFGMVLVMQPVELLSLRWSRVNAELPLLALMPRLGQAKSCKRAVLHTAIKRPAMRLGLLLLIGWLGTASLHAGWPVALAMYVVALGCLGYLCAMALSIFGGRPLSRFGTSLLLIGMFVLLSLTVLGSQLWHSRVALNVTNADVALLAAWLDLTLFLLWLGWRGWRALQLRPHPFLPN